MSYKQWLCPNCFARLALDGQGDRLRLVARPIGGETHGPTPGDVGSGDPLRRPLWHMPVGTPEAWYCATEHNLSYDPEVNQNRLGGELYSHTGIDLNLDRPPYGDVDRGEPTFSISDATVTSIYYSTKNLLAVVYEIKWAAPEQVLRWDRNIGNRQIVSGSETVRPGDTIFVRHWHLSNDGYTARWAIGDRLAAGDVVGYLGDYPNGGDHLHFDMALDPFQAGTWHTVEPDARWVDPIDVLLAHADKAVVMEMLGRGDG